MPPSCRPDSSRKHCCHNLYLCSLTDKQSKQRNAQKYVVKTVAADLSPDKFVNSDACNVGTRNGIDSVITFSTAARYGADSVTVAMSGTDVTGAVVLVARRRIHERRSSVTQLFRDV